MRKEYMQIFVLVENDVSTFCTFSAEKRRLEKRLEITEETIKKQEVEVTVLEERIEYLRKIIDEGSEEWKLKVKEIFEKIKEVYIGSDDDRKKAMLKVSGLLVSYVVC